MQSPITVISYLSQFIKHFKKHITALFVVAISYSLLSNTLTYAGKKIVDLAQTGINEQLGAVQYWLIVYIGASILFFITIRGYDFFSKDLYVKGVASLELQLTERMLDHSYAFYLNHLSGTITGSITGVSEGCLKLLKFIMNDLITPCSMAVFTIYSFYAIHPSFGIALSIWFITAIGISTWSILRNQQVFTQASKSRALVKGHLSDTFSNITTVRLFAGKKTELAYLGKKMSEYTLTSNRRDTFLFYLNSVQGILFLVFQILCMYWLYKGLLTQTLSAGDGIIIFTLSTMFINMLWSFSKHLYDACEHYGAIKHGLNLIFQPITIVDKPNAQALVVHKGTITFSSIYFSYPHTKPLFQNFSVTIPAQQKVGIVGYSGSGKSTFLNLALRLYDIQSGIIMYDNQPIVDVTQESLHQQVSIIPQEPILFSRTIAENIAYPHKTIDINAIMHAAKLAYAHDFIMQLPHGYHTMVGERGIKLSGGQRQRIAIARAVLKNAPILFLDEATSQLDSASESVIQDALWNAMEHKTVIAIAHRLSTLLRMDRIIVFDNGILVEDGTHQELLARNGIYAQLWRTQTGNFLHDDIVV